MHERRKIEPGRVLVERVVARAHLLDRELALDDPPAAGAHPRAERRVVEQLEEAGRGAAGAPGGTRKPFSPSRTISGVPPTVVATMASRAAIASRIAFEIPRRGSATPPIRARARIAATSRRWPRKWQCSAMPSGGAQSLHERRRAVADEHEARVGAVRITSRIACRRSVWPFTGWCMFATHATRPARAALWRVPGGAVELVQVHAVSHHDDPVGLHAVADGEVADAERVHEHALRPARREREERAPVAGGWCPRSTRVTIVGTFAPRRRHRARARWCRGPARGRPDPLVPDEAHEARDLPGGVRAEHAAADVEHERTNPRGGEVLEVLPVVVQVATTGSKRVRSIVRTFRTVWRSCPPSWKRSWKSRIFSGRPMPAAPARAPPAHAPADRHRAQGEQEVQGTRRASSR